MAVLRASLLQGVSAVNKFVITYNSFIFSFTNLFSGGRKLLDLLVEYRLDMFSHFRDKVIGTIKRDAVLEY